MKSNSLELSNISLFDIKTEKYNNSSKIKFIDLFAGIGRFKVAFE